MDPKLTAYKKALKNDGTWSPGSSFSTMETLRCQKPFLLLGDVDGSWGFWEIDNLMFLFLFLSDLRIFLVVGELANSQLLKSFFKNMHPCHRH